MSTTDRMGGFVSARIIETKNIDKFQVSGENVKITLKPDKQFLELSPKRYGIFPSATVSEEKSGIIYQINVQISGKERTGIKFISFNKYIVICKNPMGKEFVFGTKNFPLTGKKQPILSDTASGETGESLIFSGKQPNPPLILT